MGMTAVDRARARTKIKASLLARDQEMLDLEIAGVPRTEIARRFGVTPQCVGRRLKLAMEARSQRKADEYFEIENERLSAQYLRLEAIIKDPKTPPRDRVAAATAQTKVSEARMKLNGLGVTKVEQTLKVVEGGIDAEVERLAAELGLGADDTAPATATATARDAVAR